MRFGNFVRNSTGGVPLCSAFVIFWLQVLEWGDLYFPKKIMHRKCVNKQKDH